MDGLLCPKGRIPKIGTTGWRTGWWCRDHPDDALDAEFCVPDNDHERQEIFDTFDQKTSFCSAFDQLAYTNKRDKLTGTKYDVANR
jgi:hypothetical protein